jgi:hypothetical protein
MKFDIIKPATRQFVAICAAAWTLGCGNNASRAPSPTAYRWPDRFGYRVDLVAQAQRDSQLLVRYEETRVTRFLVREDRYVVASDSVLKTVQQLGAAPVPARYAPEDTLAYYVGIGRHGELSRVELGCDPAVPACAAALPSAPRLQLRRIIPRLSAWEAPRGSSWADTLEFDDVARPGGTRGSVITVYSASSDTVIGGAACWVVAWHSERRAYGPGTPSNPIAPLPPVREDGVTFIEKGRMIPVFSTWAGVSVASPDLRAFGATASGYRGRAYLVGSALDSIFGAESRR